MTKERDKDKNEEQEEGLPPVSYHVTDSYVTAIIGGEKSKEGQPKGVEDFWNLLKGAQKDPVLREQLIDALKADIESVGFLVNEIRDEENIEYRASLLSMCWESGLDMSMHLNFFIQLAEQTNDPLQIIELQTIIQEINPQDESRTKTALSLKKAAENKTDPIVKEILLDIVYFLES
ncbi:MAG: hypothetical protein ACHQRM_10495 [Bacteroidia bacterium]